MAVFRVHKTNDYTVMANHHLRNMGLSLSAKGLLSVILSLPPDWNYSIHGLASINKEGDKAIKSALDELREHGYVVVTRVNPTPGNNRVTYRYDIYETPHQLGESEKPQVSQAYPSEGVQVEGVQAEALLTGGQLNTKELSKEYQDTEEYIPPQKKPKQDAFPQFVEEVVGYLNERTGKSFRASSKQTRSLIHARAKEGYALDDFRRVIDVKCSQWLNDPKMSKYLQPSTLFGTKFEGYANEQPPRQRADYSGVMSGWKVEHWGDAHGS